MIRIDSVTKRYPDGTVAVDRLSLDIPDRSITVLVGPSGCGKTTTLRMINRMVEPTEGTILLDGKDVTQQPVNTLRRSMGYVIQNAGLFQHRTILDNIATVPRLLGWGKDRARGRARELMERVGLDAALAKRYPYQLSGGQQQRVGVARALAADPPVLLMDEPFSAVDPVVRKGLQDELLRIQAELGKTIVFVTHDIDEAVKLGTMVAVLRTGGRLAQYAPPAELLSAPADAFVEDFLGADRGIRRLSFFPATDLALLTTPIVAVDATAEQIAARATGETPYLLVTGLDGRPLGWSAPHELTAGSIDPGRLLSHGRPFVPGTDSLRAALDCAVLSPTGWAVAVGADGRVTGVVSQQTIAEAIRGAHAAVPADAPAAAPPSLSKGGPSDAKVAG
ncbi:proline/glycine betaine ABC transporter ATP-binding protein [Streptomyces longwoodensis]|uniref:ABC-type quaternary amine transporter n=1 Tax=Streptomyces longwoodensis TaxID=68231 RepID=A0A101R1X5_9ACTN|nr:ABC transporter ATP-binding protein [Streptomyces longwoodensis]KUN40180.1 proline/glycine betaine ABC transporter ATP-binding protein [Streptomyces longwoodensis]